MWENFVEIKFYVVFDWLKIFMFFLEVILFIIVSSDIIIWYKYCYCCVVWLMIYF